LNKNGISVLSNIIASKGTIMLVILSVVVVGINTTLVAFMSFAIEHLHGISQAHLGEANTTIIPFWPGSQAM